MNLSSVPGLSAAGYTPYAPQKAAVQSRAPEGLDSLSSAAQRSSRLEMMEQRVDDLQDGAVNMAQDMMSQFASQLFGDAAGVTFSFDSLSVSAESTFAAVAQRSSGPNGSTSAAAVRLQDSASFTGKGTIRTADGRSFSFEIEVSYEASMEAAAAQSVSAPSEEDAPQAGSDFMVDFAGTVADLFRLFSQNLLETSFDHAGDAAKEDKGGKGNLRMRLLDLLEQPEQQPQQKKLADAYRSLAPANLVEELA